MNKLQITIPRAVFEQLVKDSHVHDALRLSGVENWEWYDEAMEEYRALYPSEQ